MSDQETWKLINLFSFKIDFLLALWDRDLE